MKAGHEAGLKIDIGAIAQQVAEEAKKLAEAQANDINAFQTMGVEAAEEAGKKAGEENGKGRAQLSVVAVLLIQHKGQIGPMTCKADTENKGTEMRYQKHFNMGILGGYFAPESGDQTTVFTDSAELRKKSTTTELATCV